MGISWQDNIPQYINAVSSQRADQFDLLLLHGTEGGKQCDNASEDSHRYSRHYDGLHIISQPYDKHRGKGGFGQTVQHHQIGLAHLCHRIVPPEQDGSENSKKHDKKET